MVGIALWLLNNNKVSEECSGYKQESIIDWGHLMSDIVVNSSDEIYLKSFDLRVEDCGFCIVGVSFAHF